MSDQQSSGLRNTAASVQWEMTDLLLCDFISFCKGAAPGVQEAPRPLACGALELSLAMLGGDTGVASTSCGAGDSTQASHMLGMATWALSPLLCDFNKEPYFSGHREWFRNLVQGARTLLLPVGQD